jgi:hypothetical protein
MICTNLEIKIIYVNYKLVDNILNWNRFNNNYFLYSDMDTYLSYNNYAKNISFLNANCITDKNKWTIIWNLLMGSNCKSLALLNLKHIDYFIRVFSHLIIFNKYNEKDLNPYNRIRSWSICNINFNSQQELLDFIKLTYFI